MADSPIETLKLRFVNGEITQAEYREMLSVLVPSTSSPGNAAIQSVPPGYQTQSPIATEPRVGVAPTTQGAVLAHFLVSITASVGVVIIAFSGIYDLPLEPAYLGKYGVIEMHPASLITVPLFIFVIGEVIATWRKKPRATWWFAVGFAAIVVIQFFLVVAFTSNIPGRAVGWGWIPILIGTGLILIGTKARLKKVQ